MEKKQLYNELIENVVNARFCVEFRAYRAKFTARGSENKENNLTLRQSLDSYSRKRQAVRIRIGKEEQKKVARNCITNLLSSSSSSSRLVVVVYC